MSRISIRRVNEWDAPALLKLYSPYLSDTSFFSPEEVVPTLPEFIQRIDRYTYWYGWVMCEIDSVPVGFCRLYENPEDPENPFSLSVEIYVGVFAQRMGVGTAMLELITRIMAHGNRREIWAHIPQSNSEAVAFFEKQQFHVMHTKSNLLYKFGKSLNTLCMKRQLYPDDPNSTLPTKPYLIVNNDYECARAHAASLINTNVKRI